ncbi:MAG: SiaB family protein kinase [Campylobacterota bacterium]|nr:SiaB family protein kinase [Campylobacterota bacterium]
MNKIIDFNGELKQSHIGIFMQDIENNISNMTIMANISTIVIEIAQNIMNYSKTIEPSNRNIKPDGSISVEKDINGIYFITGTNIVSIEDKIKIEPKLLEIQSLDKAGIKKRYKELRRSGKNTHSKGGGVGTYEIAKISDNVDYFFENINDDKYYYTIKVKINPKKKEINSKKTILIVDDSVSTSNKLKTIFEEKSYLVIEVSSTEEALDIIDEKSIDLMLLNDIFPNSNGIEFLKDNHNHIINLLKIPIFITSENITPTIIKESLQYGAKDILRKPYIIEELVIKVDMWIDSKSKELENKAKLKILNEYKDAVDESAIVTKTDLKGFITYVNDQFCNISGYSRDELLGVNHHIIRDPETDKQVYKDMWHTIRELKKPWSGEIKNRRKDGSAYWVKSFIKPILDIDNNIIEYIAIRVDITQIREITTS